MQAKKQDPEPLKLIVDRWLKKSGLDSGLKKYKVFSAWDQIADDLLKKHTYPIRYVRQVLDISVDSPSFYFELMNFRKRELLEKIQGVSSLYIKDIHFICGKVDNQ